MRRPGWLILTGAVLALLSSCASLGPDTAAAAGVAAAFHQALSISDGAAACALLAPETAAQVTKDTDDECADAVVDQDFPRQQRWKAVRPSAAAPSRDGR